MEEKVIFFDLFDTLVKINRGYLEKYFDKEIDLLGDKGILRNSQTTIDKIIEKYPDVLNYYEKEVMINYYDGIMSEALLNIDIDVLNMLKNLKELGYKLCIISDASFVDIQNYKNSPLYKYFDNAIFSCYYGYTKPDINLYTIAKKVMNNPSECIFVGDGGHCELMGAKEANMTTIKVERYKKIDNYNCVDFLVDDLEEIVDIIKKC